MTNHTDNEYPSNWHAGVGEASRPLHERGYYLHLYYRVLPGSNQHTERFLELRVDTANMPPKTHVLELNYCTEDGTEVHEEKRLASESVRVDDPDSEEAQADAEETAQARAEELMAEYADWTP